MKYRPEVDGLRALAVIPVVLYHAKVPGFSGGFIGVDIFFVISGFLITSLIWQEIRAESFSILHFYERRARRILPALFAVMLFSAVFAYRLFLDSDLQDFAKSLIATSTFVSNFYFASGLSYFAAPSEVKPLLHTWSLAIEEQFYIVYPLLLLAIFRGNSKRTGLVVTILALVSLAFSIVAVYRDPSQAFYSPISRAWELLLGAILALGVVPELRSRRIAEAVSVGGIGLIVASIALLDHTSPFPGASALAPCLGSFLIIWANSKVSTSCARMLSLRPLVFIGLISYSLYLWHWPVLVFFRYYALRPLTPAEIVCAIALALLLSLASWSYVEKPFRRRPSRFNQNEIFRWAIVGAAGFFLFGAVGSLSSGFPNRHGASKLETREPNKTNGCFDSQVQGGYRSTPPCRLGAANLDKVDFVLWGDSHANIWFSLLDKLALEHNRSGAFFGKSDCAPLLGMQRRNTDDSCQQFNKLALEFIESNSVKNIILAARWNVALGRPLYELNLSENEFLVMDSQSLDQSVKENLPVYERALNRTLKRLRGLGLNVWFVYQAPYPGYRIPQLLAMRPELLESEDARMAMDEGVQRNRKIRESFTPILRKYGVNYLEPELSLCIVNTCLIARDGMNLYRDDDHLTSAGTQILEPVFTKVVKGIDDHGMKTDVIMQGDDH